MPRYNEAVRDDGYELGTVVDGRKVGYKDKHSYIWMDCLDCGKRRYVRLVNNEPEHELCVSCSLRRSWEMRRIER